jgi:CheY-like chemotaxis protein
MVDDNPMEHFIARALFKHYGIFESSVHFQDGRSAFKYVENSLQFKEKIPDIIFLDLFMPGFSGIDFLNDYRQIAEKMTKKIIIYIFSSSVSPLDHELPYSYPFVHSMLIKPLNYKTLQTIINHTKSLETQ